MVGARAKWTCDSVRAPWKCSYALKKSAADKRFGSQNEIFRYSNWLSFRKAKVCNLVLEISSFRGDGSPSHINMLFLNKIFLPTFNLLIGIAPFISTLSCLHFLKRLIRSFLDVHHTSFSMYFVKVSVKYCPSISSAAKFIYFLFSKMSSSFKCISGKMRSKK